MSLIPANDSPLLELSKGHESAVLACKFLNSGTTAISSGLDAHLSVWDLPNSKNYVIENLFRQSPAITALATLDGPLVVAGASSSQIALVDIQTGQKLRNYTGHTRAVNQIYPLSNDKFVSVSDDGSAKLWDTHQKKPVWEVSTEFPLFTVVAPADNHTFYTSGLDPTITAYDLRDPTGQELFCLENQHSDSVTSIDVTSGLKMCSFGFDNEICLQDAKQNPTRDFRSLGVIDASFNDNSNKFLIRNRFINDDQHIICGNSLFDVTSKERLVDFTAELQRPVSVIDIDYDKDSRKVMMSADNGSLYVYQL
ncbi:LAFA_0G22232g1_1 [Lachancea sp. 'fantastica']|nr:LAFA_0G22232g1_1 [Lachancea sp. 'fantastica']